MFRFSIRELLLITAVVALAVGWWVEHRGKTKAAEEAAYQEWKNRVLEQALDGEGIKVQADRESVTLTGEEETTLITPSSITYEQARSRQQKAKVEAIEKLGGEVLYDNKVQLRSPAIRQILGDDKYGTVLHVKFFASTTLTDADLVLLSGLTKLRHLVLKCTQVSDAGLVHLSGLTSLNELFLDNTQVTDAGLVHLAGLRKLQTLSLDKTQVTDAGLVQLKRLPLAYLSLKNTQVTDAGIAELQKALPNCRILR